MKKGIQEAYTLKDVTELISDGTEEKVKKFSLDT